MDPEVGNGLAAEHKLEDLAEHRLGGLWWGTLVTLSNKYGEDCSDRRLVMD